LSQADRRKELAEEEAKDLALGKDSDSSALLGRSPATFIMKGLDIEEAQ